MSALTSKLSLYLPGGGLSGLITPDEQVDIDKINDNMKKIDTAMGYTICTSGTRPAIPFQGQVIYETDTKRVLMWNSGWSLLEGSGIVFNVLDVAARASLPASNGDLALVRTSGRFYRWDGISAAWRSIGGMQQCQPVAQGSSGTTSVTSGRISFANSTFVYVDGIFTDEFDTYEIFIEEFGSAHSSFLRWRTGGVELGTGYINQQTVKNGTIVGSQPNGTNMPLATQANTQKSTKITLFKARTAGYSKAACALTMEVGASMAVTEVESNAGSAVIDGFVIYFSIGTSNGTIDVFGYNTKQAQ